MRQRKQQDSTATPDMTPMLDVVFILLIFFIVTTTFVKQNGLDWSSNDPNQVQTPTQVKPLLITIDEIGTINIQGRDISLGALRANIESAKATAKYAGVLVQAHELAATKVLVAVADQVKLSGIQQVVVSKM